jgi:hypothetical protein
MWRSGVVPSLWFLEIANTLLKLERTRRIPAGHRRKALAELAKLSPQVDDAPAVSAFTAVSDVAEKYGLSVYDAALFGAGFTPRSTAGIERPAASRSREKGWGLGYTVTTTGIVLVALVLGEQHKVGGRHNDDALRNRSGVKPIGISLLITSMLQI